MCVCVRLILGLVWKTLILVLVWGTYYVPATNVCTWYQPADHSMVPGSTYYVPATYVPGISRQSMVPGTYVQYRATSPPKQRAARGRTRLTTVTSISCRSF